MVIELFVTLKDLPKLPCNSKKEEFKKVSTNELVKNLATLLDENSSGDIKIISKDDGELYAHKAILQVNIAFLFKLNFIVEFT